MFVRPPTQQESAYVPFHRRGMAEREVEGEAVVRTADDGDPELPVYCE
jgi:hypothetical protein